MNRLHWLIAALAGACLLAALASQGPRPRLPDAPPETFSALRAMEDVRSIARAPHPVGTAEHARVRDHLVARLTGLGLETSLHTGTLSEASRRRLARWDIGVENPPVVNIVGLLPGRDRTAPAVLLMAHYDTVPGSPGAADDSAGVAAILEAVRGVRARGPARRDLIVLFTDGEELGLDGANAFFSTHPLRARVGQVINLEARGGGGRAMMFETGRANAGSVDFLARTAPRIDGGVTSNALAVFVYELMPNGTDFTVPKKQRIGGLNFAFIGRPSQYHDPSATPDALDEGALQHLGSQALEVADALVRVDRLPAKGENRVFADLFGRMVISLPPASGWAIALFALGLAGFAAWRMRPSLLDAGRGALDGLWFLGAGVVLTHGVRVLAGPSAARADSAETYYTLLRRLPWMEAGAALTVLALILLLLAGRRPARWIGLGLVALAALAVTVAEGPNPLVLGAAALAGVLTGLPVTAAEDRRGGALGLLGVVLAAGLVAQAMAPAAAFLFLWPALLAAAGLAVAAATDPRLDSPFALLIATTTALVGAAWMIYLAHPVFLGVGMDLPGLMALLGLVALAPLRVLAPENGRALRIAAAVSLLLACGLSAGAQFAEPMRPAARST